MTEYVTVATIGDAFTQKYAHPVFNVKVFPVFPVFEIDFIRTLYL